MKSAFTDGSQRTGKLHLYQTDAVGKGVVPNADHAFRDTDAGKARTVSEQVSRKRSYSRRDHDFLQAGAALESGYIHFFECGRQLDVPKIGLASKCAAFDLRYAVGNCLPRKRSAITKSTYSFE